MCKFFEISRIEGMTLLNVMLMLGIEKFLTLKK